MHLFLIYQDPGTVRGETMRNLPFLQSRSDLGGITFPQANRGTSVFRQKTITGIPAGLTSIGVGMVRDAGAGNLLGAASATQQVVLLLEIV